MPDIYDQHKAAFRAVSAYVILRDGEKVATVAFKYPATVPGAFMPMCTGLASLWCGASLAVYGYDKHSAATSSAARNLDKTEIEGPLHNAHLGVTEFISALRKDDGNYWHRRLEGAGFTVLQAV